MGEQFGNVMRTYCELEKNRLGMRENDKKTLPPHPNSKGKKWGHLEHMQSF
jgi:hypothetical protein